MLLQQGAATVTAYGLKVVASQLPPIMARFVPFAAVAGANCVNLPFMRRNEIRNGIAVFDKDGKHVGKSSTAAKKALFKWFSRVFVWLYLA
ncbi:unnamed protein product [Sphagnum troendelagicum]|uniref:Uncharacterized protein n=1 Tax=Sphagnum troendelagicum TaxID=128251 RepID=A0ABP0T6Y4_9BRYO